MRAPPPPDRDVVVDGRRQRHAGAARGDERDVPLARLAATQANLVSIRQLHDLGLSDGAVAERVRSGRLHPVHRGVYSVGSPLLPPLGRERAALLAVSGSVLSHGSAASVWSLLPPHPSGPVEVVATTQRRSRRGIRVHRTADLDGDVRRHRGLAVTSPARVVLDLTPRLDDAALERLLAEALAIDPGARSELERRGTQRTARLLGAGPRRTRSTNERRLLAVIRQAGLPVPQTNVPVHGFEVDAFWPDHRLALEVDDPFTHGDRVAFVRDRRRDAELLGRGIATLRVPTADLDGPPARLAVKLERALTARPARRRA